MKLKNMKIIDISWPISTEITGYKNKKTVSLEKTKNFEKDNVRETVITINSHTGTHVDAPAHFLKDGKTIDQIPLDTITGPCTILDMTHITEKISREDLDKYKDKIIPNEILLLKTKNSSHSPTKKFNLNFVYLDTSGAQFLKEKKIKAIGIDYLGIERNQPDHQTHTTLMNANITIIEGLRLEDVVPGNYIFICLPLNIIGLDASPARAIIMGKT